MGGGSDCAALRGVLTWAPMVRTGPSAADAELLNELATRGVRVTMTQLERWRATGLLAPNVRHGSGRGSGSTAQSPKGAADYVEALVTAAGQGRNHHRTALSLFTAGVLEPRGADRNGEIYRTYETAVRRAFRWQIDRGNKSLRLVRSAVRSGTATDDDGLDEAFQTASDLLDKDRKWIRAQQRAALLSSKIDGVPPPGVDRIRGHNEFALLQASLGTDAVSEPPPPLLDLDNERHVPIDAGIFLTKCSCQPRTRHFPSSPEGLHEILATATFSDLNFARAVGCATLILAMNIRSSAAANPDDEKAKAAALLFSHTFFRVFLRSGALFSLDKPESVVNTTLLFLNSCQWLRSAAALVVELSGIWIPGGGESTLAVFEVLRDHLPRARFMKAGLTGMLILQDASAMALGSAQLLKDGRCLAPHAV
jgi:hypothetical protein